jgi:hypothetical protein
MAFERPQNYRFMNGSARVLDVERWASSLSMMTKCMGYLYEYLSTGVIHKPAKPVDDTQKARSTYPLTR